MNDLDVLVEDVDDLLAQYIFELFRRSLDVGAEQPPNQLANNGLLLVRGAKFRRVRDGISNEAVDFMWILVYFKSNIIVA